MLTLLADSAGPVPEVAASCLRSFPAHGHSECSLPSQGLCRGSPAASRSPAQNTPRSHAVWSVRCLILGESGRARSAHCPSMGPVSPARPSHSDPSVNFQVASVSQLPNARGPVSGSTPRKHNTPGRVYLQPPLHHATAIHLSLKGLAWWRCLSRGTPLWNTFTLLDDRKAHFPRLTFRVREIKKHALLPPPWYLWWLRESVPLSQRGFSVRPSGDKRLLSICYLSGAG